MANYGENLIPIMTSANTPSGSVTASTQINNEAWKAFDGNNTSTGWNTSTNVTTGWIAYEFTNPIVVDAYIVHGLTDNRSPKNFTFEGWNGSQWVILDTRANITNYSTPQVFLFTNSVAYKKYRINVTANNGYSTFLGILELSMHKQKSNKILLLANSKNYFFEKGGLGKNLVPLMTSNTAPSGIASASSNLTTSHPAYLAFSSDDTKGWVNGGGTTGWLKYEFILNSTVEAYSLSSFNGLVQAPKDWTFEGSNDGNIWTVLDARRGVIWNTLGETKEFIINDNSRGSYKSYRINVTAVNGGNNVSIGKLKMVKLLPHKAIQIPTHLEQNFIKYGMDSPVQLDGIFSSKNYILQDTVSENADGLWVVQLDRKPSNIKFE